MSIRKVLSRRIGFRRERITLLLAGFLYFLLSQHLLIDGLILSTIFLPSWIATIFFFVSLSGFFVLSYSSARTFAPYEDPRNAPFERRYTVFKIIAVVVFCLWAIGFISYNVINVPLSTLKPMSWIFAGAMYVFVIYSGWDSGRIHNVKEVIDLVIEHEEPPEYSSLAKVFMSETKGRFWGLFIIAFISGVLASVIFQSVIAIFSVSGSMFTLFGFIKMFYPSAD